MNGFKPQKEIPPGILATDLDGTLIPLPGNAQNQQALKALAQARETNPFGLIYATGRHTESVLEAMKEYRMPKPDWIISNVGTSIHQRNGDNYIPFEAYQEHLLQITECTLRETVESTLANLQGMQLQPPVNQKRFKISYESEPDRIDALVETINNRLTESGIPFVCMGSLDPFVNRGLLDVLPKNVTKAYALLWLSSHANFQPDEVIYSGDSGNDLAALVAGFRAIVVANASKGLADQVQAELAAQNLQDRLFRAEGTATTGVLEGCLHFGLID